MKAFIEIILAGLAATVGLYEKPGKSDEMKAIEARLDAWRARRR